MLGTKKINVFEDKYGLSIDFKWWSPMAIFFGLFTTFWVGFLVMWYTIGLTTGAPIVMLLFPLIHVAVGIYLMYTTLTLFLNKTFITVQDGYLKIVHRPIPWWKGNFEMETADIEQLYVKETIVRGKNNSKTQRYHLRAKLVTGEDIEVMSVTGVESQDMLLIEEKLEAHIGINDEAVRGEFGRSASTIERPQPRRQRRDKILDQGPLSLPIEVGDPLSLDNINYEVKHHTQFDWKNGDSDRLLQIIDEEGKPNLLYLKQNKGIIESYTEVQMPLLKSSEIFFLKANPPKTISYEGKTFVLNTYLTGDAFLSSKNKPISTEQWFYKDLDNESFIRIEVHDNLTTYFIATPLEQEKINFEEDRLELRDLDIEESYERNYRDEDLV